MKRAVAIVLSVVGALLVAGAAWGLFATPEPHVLTCERTAPNEIHCEPGNARGASALVHRQSGKSSRDCFVLGATWLCGGDSATAAARVNALAPGDKVTVDVTAPRAHLSEVGFAGLLGLALLVIGLRKVRT